VPLLTPQDVVCYGHALSEEDIELRLLAELDIAHVHVNEVHADPVAAAQRARQRIEVAAFTESLRATSRVG